MREMRRKTGLVTDPAMIEKCLQESVALHVGFIDEGDVYIVPVNFGYTIEDGKYTLYFHGAKRGRKADLAAAGPKVGFEMETGLAPNPAELACDNGEKFLSIIGNGVCTIVEDRDEKILAFDKIMVKNTGKDGWEYPEPMVNATAVFKIDVDELCCKQDS